MIAKEILKHNNCRTDREYFNKILDYYFEEQYNQVFMLLKNLTGDQRDVFWSYANSRFITREDSIDLFDLMRIEFAISVR